MVGELRLPVIVHDSCGIYSGDLPFELRHLSPEANCGCGKGGGEVFGDSRVAAGDCDVLAGELAVVFLCREVEGIQIVDGRISSFAALVHSENRVFDPIRGGEFAAEEFADAGGFAANFSGGDLAFEMGEDVGDSGEEGGVDCLAAFGEG